ncbi:MAG: DUF58 domain-containing protein [Sedimentisphaerales bacterium]
MNRTEGRLRLGLTDAGKMVLRGIGFVALAALIVPAFGVLSTLVSVVLMALLVGFVLRPKIQLSGNLPDRVVVGQTVQLKYVLKNIARLPAYNLCLGFGALPEAIEQVAGAHEVWRLGPGETAEVTVAIRPRRRGCYRIKQPICQSGFPFNLFTFGNSLDNEEILIVLPAFSLLQIPLKHISRYAHAGGARLAGRTGVDLEYVGNRPFLQGDSPRNIDARAWARLSVPATKEFHDDFDNCTALVLDTGVHEVISGSAPLEAGVRFLTGSRSKEIKELEAAVSLCASVAFTINNDCLIDFLLAGPDLYQFTAWPRMVRLDKIHEILAGVEPSRGFSLEQIAPKLANRFLEISEVFFICFKWDNAYRQLLELADQAGCHCKVLLIARSGGSQKSVDAAPDDASEVGSQKTDFCPLSSVFCLLSADDILNGQIERL